MNIKPGDVVRLRSGGEKMTVHSIESGKVNGVVIHVAFCGWFERKKLQLRSFPFHMLELA